MQVGGRGRQVITFIQIKILLLVTIAMVIR